MHLLTRLGFNVAIYSSATTSSLGESSRRAEQGTMTHVIGLLCVIGEQAPQELVSLDGIRRGNPRATAVSIYESTSPTQTLTSHHAASLNVRPSVSPTVVRRGAVSVTVTGTTMRMSILFASSCLALGCGRTVGPRASAGREEH